MKRLRGIGRMVFRGADKGKKGKVGQLEWREGLTSLSASLTLPTFNTIRLHDKGVRGITG